MPNTKKDMEVEDKDIDQKDSGEQETKNDEKAKEAIEAAEDNVDKKPLTIFQIIKRPIKKIGIFLDKHPALKILLVLFAIAAVISGGAVGISMFGMWPTVIVAGASSVLGFAAKKAAEVVSNKFNEAEVDETEKLAKDQSNATDTNAQRFEPNEQINQHKKTRPIKRSGTISHIPELPLHEIETKSHELKPVKRTETNIGELVENKSEESAASAIPFKTEGPQNDDLTMLPK